jgi:drug/metabolite transporter (DMT)-like permease
MAVGLAAMAWASDGIFRTEAVSKLSTSLIVLIEHLLGLVVLAPWILIRHRNSWKPQGARAWISLLLVGAAGSAGATLLFTASFRFGNPTVSVLLQKTQPIFVVVLATLFLKERLPAGFWRWAPLALFSAIWVSFPELELLRNLETLSAPRQGSTYALGAAILWALSTILGKSVTGKYPASVVAFWRFAFGALAIGVPYTFLVGEWPSELWTDPELQQSLVFMGLVSGIFAMVVYYFGMKRTPAIGVTMMELLFPVGAMVINWKFLGVVLSPLQVSAACLLLVSVLALNFEGIKNHE